jgi:hypothetical protein
MLYMLYLEWICSILKCHVLYYYHEDVVNVKRKTPVLAPIPLEKKNQNETISRCLF